MLSHGRKAAIDYLILQAGLAQCFRKVFASDVYELQAVGQIKGKVIERYLAHKGKAIAASQVLLVDDLQQNLDHVVCQTHLVADRAVGLSK